MLEWDVHERVIYELEHAEKLVAISIGNRVWYSRAQLTSLLGEPPNAPHRPARTEKRDKGGYQERFDLAEVA